LEKAKEGTVRERPRPLLTPGVPIVEDPEEDSDETEAWLGAPSDPVPVE
jgi:hypothetical protein